MYRRRTSDPMPNRTPEAKPSAGRAEEPGVDAMGVLSIAAIIALAILIAGHLHRAHEPAPGAKPANLAAAATSSGSAFDPAPFMLNALLVPALDADSEPLVWTDPRPVAQCGPATTVLVNRKPLVPGALVGDGPFALEWRADDCHPFGVAGPRLDGTIRLNVFHEAEFGAIVETSTMRAMLADGRSVAIAPRWLALARGTDSSATVHHD
jgi:hypothetical protein